MVKLKTVLKNRIVHIFVSFLSGVYFLVSSYEPAKSGVADFSDHSWSKGMSFDPILFCIGAALILASWISYKKWAFESTRKEE
ncbi:MAG: hypothetical protein HQ510_12120 [Candidatus Marinimicrobia bacterium]|nr:hypothetical protein [Candidatus Neomarinimicrobiota bacterium]